MVGKEFWADTKRGGKILVPDVTISSVLAWETEAEWTARQSVRRERHNGDIL